MVQADAPVYIILGVMAVLVGLIPVLGFVESFAGGSQETNQEQLHKLATGIENTCEMMDEYETVLTSTVDINLKDEAEIEFDNGQLELNHPTDRTSRLLECNKDINFDVIGEDEDKIKKASSTASISGESGTVNVEVE